MRRTRHQSRLEKKLKQDNKARTDVSRKSLPKKTDDTLVPDITFSNICPETTLQNTSVQSRRSSLQCTRSSSANDKLVTESLAASDDGKLEATSSDETSENVLKNATKKECAEDAEAQKKVFSRESTQVEIQEEDVALKCHEDLNYSQSSELSSSLVNTSRRATKARSSNIPTTGQRKESKKSDIKCRKRSQRLTRDNRESRSDENSHNNSSLNSKLCPREGSRKKAEESLTLTGTEDKDVPDKTTHRKQKPMDSDMENPVGQVSGELEKVDFQNTEQNVQKQVALVAEENAEENAEEDAEENTEENAEEDVEENAEEDVEENAEENIDENMTENENIVTKECRVLLDGFTYTESSFGAKEHTRQPPTAANNVLDEDVSAETLEIRKRIKSKCLQEAASSDDEEDSRHEVVNSEKLFDSLFIFTGKAEKTIDRSSFYNGTIPSSLLSPEPLSKSEQKHDHDGSRDSESLTQRFAALKKSNVPRAVCASPKKAQGTIVPSFTLEEEATNNNLEEVTHGVQRAITLCEEDSDADLDVVMNSKRHRGNGSSRVSQLDPVYCDIGTSMGLLEEQKDSESFVLMIESASRDPNDIEAENGSDDVAQNKAAIPFEQANLEVQDACVSDGDQGQELKQARKSKLQSTLLPSPKFAASVAVCTGPSLMNPELSRQLSQVIETGTDLAQVDRLLDGTDCCEKEAKNVNEINNTILLFDHAIRVTPEQDIDNDFDNKLERHASVDKLAEDPSPVNRTRTIEVENHKQDDLDSEREQSKRNLPSEHESSAQLNHPTSQLDDDDSVEIVFEALVKKPAVNSIDPVRVRAQTNADEIPVEEECPVVENRTELNGSALKTTPQHALSKISEHSKHEVALHNSEQNSRCSTSKINPTMNHLLPQTNDPFVGKTLCNLIDLIDDVHDDKFVPDCLVASPRDALSKILSPKTHRAGDDGQPVFLFYVETPKNTSSLMGNYKVGGRTRPKGVSDTPHMSRNAARSRVGRRTLFEETDEVLDEVLPITGTVQPLPERAGRPRPKSFVLDSARLPNFDDAHVDMQFDVSELKKRGEELFQAAARNLFERNSEHKRELQAALEDLFSTNEADIKRLMTMLVKKSALNELCDTQKESYIASQARLQRSRKFIRSTTGKLLSHEDRNVAAVFGFNPFNCDLPPPAHIREINKRKAREEEERTRKRLKQQSNPTLPRWETGHSSANTL